VVNVVNVVNSSGIHLISDDVFFSLGCEVIFQKNNYKLNKIPSEKVWQEDLTQEFSKGDVCLVAMRSYLASKIVLEKLSYHKVKIMLFLDIPEKKETRRCVQVFNVWFLSKKMSMSLLISRFENLFEYHDSTEKLLTKREIEVMENILQGKSFAEVSVALNIALKTVYTHRRNLFHKIGVRDSHAIYSLIIKLFSCNKPTT